MSSNRHSGQVDQATRDKLEAAQNRLAAANSEIADALEQSTGLLASPHPRMALRNTHGELLNAYQELRQAIDMVERTMDELADDHHDPTPHQIKSDHADRIGENYPEPLSYLAVDLLAANRRKWLHAKPETNGAREVERHGLTANQRHWLNEIRDGCESN